MKRSFIITLMALAAAVIAAFAAMATPARADASTVYHYTDNSTGACTEVTFPQDNWFNTQVGAPNHISEATALKFISHGGVFGVGWVATGQVDVIPSYVPEFANLYVGGPSQDPTGGSGTGGPYVSVAKYTLATGACPITPQMMAQENHILACASRPVMRGDGTMGLFLDLADGYLALGSWNGVTFTPAPYYVGVGSTCDQLPGYHASGRKVDSSDQPGNGGSIYTEYVHN